MIPFNYLVAERIQFQTNTENYKKKKKKKGGGLIGVIYKNICTNNNKKNPNQTVIHRLNDTIP